MCGIAGYVGNGNESTLRAMVDAIKHRGPDHQQTYVREQIGFGHARLSIIDLSSAGHQPMVDESSGNVIVFNGEIYNFRELKKYIFLHDPQPFKSDSDTEVILRLYKLEGIDCIKRLRGMFAIAIYDQKEVTLHLVRDRLGKKPLYWTKTPGTIVFASELKSLLKHGSVTQEIDDVSLCQFFMHDYVPTPRSIYKNIQKLEPASVLTYKADKITISSFWNPPKQILNIDFTTASGQLDELIEDSVQCRLIADVPVGVFLSGGIDSSAVAYYAQKMSVAPVSTFSIGFDEESFDESAQARQVASYLGTDHHEKVLSANEMLNILPNIIQLTDEPLADTSVIPTYLLAEFTREHVAVALGGDGGDELFAGYPTFNAERYAAIYALIPNILRSSVIEPIINKLPASEKNMHVAFLAQKFIEGKSRDMFKRHQQWLGSYTESDLSKLFTKTSKPNQSFSDMYSCQNYESEYYNQHKLNNLLFSYMRTYLMDLVMVKVDRMTMAHGLEARSPLLDHQLVEFILSLPYEYKFKHGHGKYIFKKLLEDKLPKNIVYRKKKGFGIPIAKWLKGPLRPLTEDLLSANTLDKQGFFNSTYVKRLLTEHFSGERDNRKKLWPLLVFQMWYHQVHLGNNCE